MRCQSFRHRLRGLAPPRIRKRSQQFTSIDRVAFGALLQGTDRAHGPQGAWFVRSDDVFAVQQRIERLLLEGIELPRRRVLQLFHARQVCGNVYPRLVELKQTHQLQLIRWRQRAGDSDDGFRRESVRQESRHSIAVAHKPEAVGARKSLKLFL